MTYSSELGEGEPAKVGACGSTTVVGEIDGVDAWGNTAGSIVAGAELEGGSDVE